MTRSQTPKSRAARTAGMFCIGALGGCSLLYDFGTQQCTVTADCRKMGPQFANAVCQNKVCVAEAATGGVPGTSTTGTGGSGAVGGTSTTFLGGSAGTGTSDPSTAGTPNVGGQTACSNDQCMIEHGNAPWICRNNACVALTTSDCPVLIPRQSASALLKQQDVIVIGGYASMANKGDFYDSQAIINWDLAFDEFNTATSGGLPPHSNGTQRPFVGLICKTNDIATSDVQRSVQHLTEDVQVPAILSTLSANYLYQAWLNQHSGGTISPKPSFFMSTSSADTQLANLADEGLVWHMLGDPRALAAPIVTLMKQLEPVVNQRRQASFLANGTDDPSTQPLRVTLVYSDEPIMIDIANVLMSPENPKRPGTMLMFNGKSWTDNGANARNVQIPSARQHTTPDVSPAIAELSAYPPHVIVAMATSEFPATVMGNVEKYWTDSQLKQIRPMYLMSHMTFNTTQLLDVAKSNANVTPPLDTRLLGANYASAQDARAQALYASYLSRLKGSYQGKLPLDDTENFYDGAYYLLYSIAAAAAVYKAPSGSNIADALLARIISTDPDAISVDVGPNPLKSTIPSLFGGAASYAYSLYGTMGAPNFDRLSGTRMSTMSAWCVQINAAGTAWEYKSNGLIFDPLSGTYARPAAGVPTCMNAYCDSATTDGGAVCRKDY